MNKSFFILAAALAITSCGSTKDVSSKQEDRAKSQLVNIGYGSVRKDENTTSTQQINPEEEQISSYSNIYDYLRGRVPGVNVLPDNTIIIRGINSPNGDPTPLFIVDGTEVSDLDFLNPSEISSISVIKDGSSAIYGVRGANGVILVETKRGK